MTSKISSSIHQNTPASPTHQFSRSGEGNFGFFGGGGQNNNHNYSSNSSLNDLGISGGGGGAPIIIDQLEWKDTYRHIFSNLPLAFFHVASLLVTFFLVFMAIADRRAMHSTWYLLLEGIMVLFFTFEIVSRYLLSRSVFGSYFKNKTNLAEALICGVCLMMFVLLLIGRSTSGGGGIRGSSAVAQERNLPHAQEAIRREETEHELVVVVRFAFQLFRGVLYLRNVARARRENAEDGRISMHHHSNQHHHHHHHHQNVHSSQV